MIDLDHFVSLMPDRIGGENITTMRDLLMTMLPEQRQQLDAALRGCPDKATAWGQLVEDFAAIAHPDTGRWPEPQPDAVLDEIRVGVKRLVSILSLIDGRLLLRIHDARAVSSTLLECPTCLMTPMEFIYYLGFPVSRYVKELIKPRADELLKAVAVLSATAPVAYEVQYADGPDQDAKLTSVVLYVRDASQIKTWAARNQYRLLDTTPFKGEKRD